MVQLARKLVKDITFTYALNVFCCNIVVVFMIVHTICILLLKLYFLLNSLVSIYKSIDFAVFHIYQYIISLYRDASELEGDLYLGLSMRHQDKICIWECQWDINASITTHNHQIKLRMKTVNVSKRQKEEQRADKVKGQKVVIILLFKIFRNQNRFAIHFSKITINIKFLNV